MSMYLVIFLLEDFEIGYVGHWTGWVEGYHSDALECAHASLMESAENQYERDMITLAYHLHKNGDSTSHTIVEVIA